MKPYVIGTGIVTIDGVDVGNCPSFTFLQEIVAKPRMRAVNGVRVPVKSPTIERRGTLKFTLDAWVDDVIDLAIDGKIGATVVVTQKNDIGPRRVWTFRSANIHPAAEMSAISAGEFAQLQFEADALFDINGDCMSYEAAP